MEEEVWGLSPHNPFCDPVICFPACDFPFQRALIHSTDMLELSAVISREGDTLTGWGIRADWPLTHPPCATSLPFGRRHSHMHSDILHVIKPHRYPHIFSPSCAQKHCIRPCLMLWYWAVPQSVYQKVSNLCWHKPSISGYQQKQTLVQSGKGISAPV